MRGNKQEYLAFTAVHLQWREECHLEAPYACYWYGASHAESIGFEQLTLRCRAVHCRNVQPGRASLMACAAAMGKPLPGCTSIQSVALQRHAGDLT